MVILLKLNFESEKAWTKEFNQVSYYGWAKRLKSKTRKYKNLKTQNISIL